MIPKLAAAKDLASRPKTLNMIIDAIKTDKNRKGSSIQRIKKYILSQYPTLVNGTLTSNLRRAVKQGLESGVLSRPKGSSNTGLTGRLRIGKLPAVKTKSAPKTRTIGKPRSKSKKPKTPRTPARKALFQTPVAKSRRKQSRIGCMTPGIMKLKTV
ncbi:sperm-specific protein PHI-2B-like [Saccoglossus kowalevskii]|uniref:Sperm-specific H1/protamine-like protein type 1-like n=1 Tax=Saccoglossus kowalevskii TaxID=10224 RepID=A0ABM0MGG3_SACKO|nr:PREDICTED: sperm-specific H1/protamine-like protein type 1-like [Saccoglossus kowalevskii]